jgi:hypothetical protein
MKEDKLEGTRSSHRGGRKCVPNFNCKHEGKRPLRTLGVCGRIILKLILRVGFIWLEITVAGSCHHENEPSGSISDGEFLNLSVLPASEDGLRPMQLVVDCFNYVVSNSDYTASNEKVINE